MIKLKHILMYGFACSLFLTAHPRLQAEAITPSLLSFADQLYAEHHYDKSITEYLRFLTFQPQHPLSFYAHYKIGMAFSILNKREKANHHFLDAFRSAPPGENRARIQYQYALSLIAGGQYEFAKIELFRLIHSNESKNVSRAAHVIYSLLLIQNNEWEAALGSTRQLRENCRDTNIQVDLKDIEKQLTYLMEKPDLKSPMTAKWLSTFLPGAGQLYAGAVGQSLNALLLNSITTYFLAKSVQEKRFRDAILIFGLLWTRYYIGNRQNAEKAAKQKNDNYIADHQLTIYKAFMQISEFWSKESLILELNKLHPPSH